MLKKYFYNVEHSRAIKYFWRPWPIFFFRILWWIESSKGQNWFEIDIFTVTFL